MKFNLNLAIVILLVSSCSITKMRYSRGFNTNFELCLKKDKTEVQELKANKAVKKQHKTATTVTLTETQAPTNTTTAEGIANNEPNTADVVTTVKKTSQPKLAKALLKPIQAVKNKLTAKQQEEGPMEPNVKLGAFLFYTSWAITLITSLAAIALSEVLVTILSLAFLAGFVLCVVGRQRIKRSDYAYSGMGLATSVIILFLIQLFLLLIYLMLIILLVAIFI